VGIILCICLFEVREKTMTYVYIQYIHTTLFRAAVSSVRYGKPADLTKDGRYIFGMSITGMILHAFTAFFLTLALNYQRLWRSGNSLNEFDNDDDDDEGIEHTASTNYGGSHTRRLNDSDNEDDNQDTDLLLLNRTNEVKNSSKAVSVAKLIFSHLFSINCLAVVLLVVVLLATSFRAR
jgi:hypothetical protein